MKGNKVLVLLWLMIGLLGMSGIELGIYSVRALTTDKLFGYDLRLRRNEIICAHQGVNSFHVWNREITLKGFTPIYRPDRSKEESGGDERFVHAYPAWHTFFFYFFGWIPETICLCLMAFLYGVCVKFIADNVLCLSKSVTKNWHLVAGFVLAMISYPVLQCLVVLNYGILLTAVFILLCKFANCNKQILAGLCWALMMIKPQLGILFFWPLFWHKKYKVILTASIVCFIATCLTAIIVHENPISMIFQIPEIGKPYDGYLFVERVLKPILGMPASYLWMGGCFCMAALLSFWTRDVRDLFVSAAPISALIPIWTYSSEHDHVILVCWYFVTLVCALKFKGWRLYWIALVLTTIVKYIGVAVSEYVIVVPSVVGWIFQVVSVVFDIITVFAAIMFSRQSSSNRLSDVLRLGERHPGNTIPKVC